MRCAASVVIVALFTGATGEAQSRFDHRTPAGMQAAAAMDDLFSRKGATALNCAVSQYPPNLTYDLKVWTGFTVSFPAKQFESGHKAFVVNVFRVTPLKPAGEPVYFHRRLDIPDIPPEIRNKRGLQLDTGGGFLVGTGEYQVDWVLVDNLDRACVARWKLKSNPPAKDRLGIEPGYVDDDSRLMRWSGPPPATDGAGKRATIFINAYPTVRRRFISKLSPWDRRLLTSAVTATIDRAGFNSVRVVVFDLDKRKVLYEDDEFTRRSYRRLLRSLGDADFATLDYSVLTDGGSEFDFLESLLSAETRRERKSDAMVFVTPSWRQGAKKRKVAEQVVEAAPTVFCLALAPRNSWVEGTVVDFVRQIKGKVQVVEVPTDLAKATDEIRQEISAERR